MATGFIPKRTDLEIVQDWAKYLYNDFSDAILDKAFKDGRLLESLEYSIRSNGGRITVEFQYLLYGAFQDMGLNAHGYSFKPNKWYSGNLTYSSEKLGEMMMRRYGALGMVRVSEIFPNRIDLG